MNYIDTSAFVKYYGNAELEKGFDKVCELIDNSKARNEVLVSSVFILGETISVFDKWLRMKLINANEFDGMLKRFLFDVNQMSNAGSFVLEPMHTYVIPFSIQLIIKHHISINDAIHLYTALSLSEIDNFVCADKILIRAAQAEGLHVFNPEED